MRKFMYITLGIILLLALLVWTGKKSVHNEVLIDASPEVIWNSIMDMSQYPDWNPVMRLVEGEVIEGNTVKYQFTQDENNKSEIGAKVVKVIPNQLLNQKGGIPLVLTFNHKYILEATSSSTKLIIHEDYNGIGVNFWDPTPVEEAYKKLNIALKNRAESQTR